jgi:hypothetical protein
MTPGQRLLIAILDQPEPPCERGCAFYTHCMTQVRACRQFQKYVRTGAEIDPPTDSSAIIFDAITNYDT